MYQCATKCAGLPALKRKQVPLWEPLLTGLFDHVIHKWCANSAPALLIASMVMSDGNSPVARDGTWIYFKANDPSSITANDDNHYGTIFTLSQTN